MVVGEPQILSQVKQAFHIAKAELHRGTPTARAVSSRAPHRQTRHGRNFAAPASREYPQRRDFRTRHLRVRNLRWQTCARDRRRQNGRRNAPLSRRRRARRRSTSSIAALNAGSCSRPSGTARFIPGKNCGTSLHAADMAISTTAANEPIVTSADVCRESRAASPSTAASDTGFGRAAGFRSGRGQRTGRLSVLDRRSRPRPADGTAPPEPPNSLPPRSIVLEETGRFVAETHLRSTAPVITGLREGLHRPKEAELERLFKKLPELDDRSREEIRQFADRLVNKLLHPPLESLRDASQNGTHHGLMDALRRLFQDRRLDKRAEAIAPSAAMARPRPIDDRTDLNLLHLRLRTRIRLPRRHRDRHRSLVVLFFFIFVEGIFLDFFPFALLLRRLRLHLLLRHLPRPRIRIRSRLLRRRHHLRLRLPRLRSHRPWSADANGEVRRDRAASPCGALQQRHTVLARRNQPPSTAKNH